MINAKEEVDRETIELPPAQEKLLEAVYGAAVQPGIHIFARPDTAERVAARSPVFPDKHIPMGSRKRTAACF